MRKILSVVLCLLAATAAHSQTRSLDSLRRQIYHTTAGHQKKQVLLAAIAQQRSMNLDTLVSYIKQAAALRPGEQEAMRIDIGRVYYNIRMGKSDSSLLLVDRNLQRLRKIAPGGDLLVFYEFLEAGLSLRRNNQKKALDHYFIALKHSEKNLDTNFQMRSLNGVGWVYMEMFQYEEAIKWFGRALSLGSGDRYGINYSPIYTNMASCYGALGKMDSAKFCAGHAIAFAERYEDFSSQANALVVNANIALFEDRITESIAIIEKAIGLRRMLNDPFYILSDLCILSNIYASINKTEQGLAAAGEALDIARRYGINAKLPMIYISFESNYVQRKDYKKLAETLTQHLQVKDSVYHTTLVEELAAQEAQYGSEKKEREIARQKLVIQHEKDTRKVLLFSLSGIILLIGAGVAVYLQRNKARQEKELFRSILEGEQKERIRIARDLHDSIGQMLSVVKMNVSGIHYRAESAERVQTGSTLDIIDKTIQEVRHISHNLIPEELSFGLANALEEMAEKINGAGTTRMVVQIDEGFEPGAFTRQFELSVYRIIQELSGNILKHAQASLVQLHLKRTGSQVLLRITDDGNGFDPAAIKDASGLGWKNIGARINLLNGKMNIQSEKIKGTTIEIWIPVTT